MAAASDVSYGTWKDPDSPYQIRYALPAFREIEFHVGEGFRRIPYGGIEHGGLLFGKRKNATIQVEAFRPVECEHAAGPSFSLSESDLAGIRNQLATFAEQPELAGLTPVGIVISHSRRDLQVTGDEKDLLDLLFPEPWQCLLLVKPEKFKPAQFGFFMRGPSRATGANLQGATFVLPLPPRSEHRSRREPQTIPSEPPHTTTPVEPVSEMKEAPRPRTRRTAAKLESANQSAKSAAKESSEPVSLPAFASPKSTLAPSLSPSPLKPRLAGGLMLLSLLPLAACFVWFYWNYLQPPIDVHAAAQPGSIVLTWPAQATSAAPRADLRVWANQQHQVIALSPAERTTGHATVPVNSKDVTIEVIAFHWLHDRRGMVRVITNP